MNKSLPAEYAAVSVVAMPCSSACSIPRFITVSLTRSYNRSALSITSAAVVLSILMFQWP